MWIVLKEKFQGAERKIDIRDIGKAFFTSSPKWGKKMFAFRNNMVRMFGLKTGAPNGKLPTDDDFTCEIGERVGLFKVFDKTDHEIILGEDDRHLDFRISLLLNNSRNLQDESSLTISTTVKYHNWLGILYFLPVRPFHKLIVPAMLKNIIAKLESK